MSCSTQSPVYAYHKERETEIIIGGLVIDVLASGRPKMPDGRVLCCGHPTCETDGTVSFCDACHADCEECRRPEGGGL